MGGAGTIDFSTLTEQLGVIAWRMAETLPEYLPFLLAGGLLILFGNVLRKPRAIAVGASRQGDQWDEDDTGSPAVALLASTVRLTVAMAMRLSGRLVIFGCFVVLTLRASGFEETTAFVEANFETLAGLVQAFR